MPRRPLSEYEKTALSDADLMRLLGKKVRIVLYPDIHRMRTLDELMGPYGAAIILFEAKPEYGHWCTVFRGAGGDKNLVEWFDPYSSFPDDTLRHIDPSFRRQTNQDLPYLSSLMMESPYKLSRSQYPFQRHGKDIKTCGRHCATRLMYRGLGIDEYADFMNLISEETGLDPDAIVSVMTSQIGPRY